MSTGKWTKRQLSRLIDEYPAVGNPRILAVKLGKSYSALKSRATLLGLKRSVSANILRTKCSKADDRFIRSNYCKIPSKRMATILGYSDTLIRTRMRQLGLETPPEIIEQFRKESFIKPGSIPPNKGKKQQDYMTAQAIRKTKKTRFKKGDLPKNTQYDGAITIRHNHKERGERPYKFIRVKQGKWELLHRYNWVKAYGRIPNNMVVVFRNGDTMNCEIDNLEIITKKENMLRNTIQRYPDDLKNAIKKLSKLKKAISNGEEQIK
jgi:hypothetical protein